MGGQWVPACPKYSYSLQVWMHLVASTLESTSQPLSCLDYIADEDEDIRTRSTQTSTNGLHPGVLARRYIRLSNSSPRNIPQIPRQIRTRPHVRTYLHYSHIIECDMLTLLSAQLTNMLHEQATKSLNPWPQAMPLHQDQFSPIFCCMSCNMIVFSLMHVKGVAMLIFVSRCLCSCYLENSCLHPPFLHTFFLIFLTCVLPKILHTRRQSKNKGRFYTNFCTYFFNLLNFIYAFIKLLVTDFIPQCLICFNDFVLLFLDLFPCS